MGIGRSRLETRLQPLFGRLFGYAFALSKDREAAADLFQECILRAYAAPCLPDADPALRAWMFKVLRNLWVDRGRAFRVAAAAQEDLHHAIDGPPGDGEAPVINMIAVRQAFHILSEDHREVLGLVDIAGFSYEEAAAMLAVPPGTIMSRVSRARRALARHLANENVVPIRTRRPREP